MIRVEYSPSARFPRVTAMLVYEDPANAISESLALDFAAGDPAQQRAWTVRLANPTLRSFRWRVRGFTGAGEVVEGAWTAGSEPVIVVDAALLAHLGA